MRSQRKTTLNNFLRYKNGLGNPPPWRCQGALFSTPWFVYESSHIGSPWLEDRPWCEPESLREQDSEPVSRMPHQKLEERPRDTFCIIEGPRDTFCITEQ